jgi:Fe-S oxidoreductase
MKIAKKAVQPILNSKPNLVASDCPLSALQLDQAGATLSGAGNNTKHPIQIIRDAYGLTEE